ncbi:MAG: hypothetical protein KAI40_03410 [Desulfobacterales bacterium]|nr:hypothetical protein [Desulfobacterales bacterium]
MAYPSIAAPTGLKIKPRKKRYKGVSEAGYTMTRAKATLKKVDFELEYSGMSSADQAALQTHFEANGSGSFSFTNPMTGGSTYTVVYSDDELGFTYVPVDHFAITIKLTEV